MMTITDFCDCFIESMAFDVVLGWADILGVEHNEKTWLDDMWPDKEDELRVAVSKAAGDALLRRAL